MAKSGHEPRGTLMNRLLSKTLLFLLIKFRESIVAYFQTEGKDVIDEGKKKKRPDFGE